MPKEFILPLRIYVENTDYGGIVYHAAYLNFMDRSRTEWLNQLGIGIDFLAKNNCHFVVRSAQIEYQKPARLNMNVEVTSALIQHGGTSLTFAHTIRDFNDNDCVFCTGEVKLVTINDSYKPIRIPKEVVEKFI